MWVIQNLDKTGVMLDFSSAGFGQFRSSALLADDTTIVNATSLLDIEEDGCVQVIVCSACGTVHCEPGGWVQPRRFGDAVIWLPCFERLADDHSEYRPPEFFELRGLPFFAGDKAQQLGDLVPLFRSEALMPLTLRDVAWLAQWTAPWQILGKSGDPARVKRELVMATSSGELTSILDQLEAILNEALSDKSSVRGASATHGPALYLDGGKQAPTWRPLVVDDVGRLRLSIDGVTAAVSDAR